MTTDMDDIFKFEIGAIDQVLKDSNLSKAIRNRLVLRRQAFAGDSDALMECSRISGIISEDEYKEWLIIKENYDE